MLIAQSDARCTGSCTNESVSERETGRVCQTADCISADGKWGEGENGLIRYTEYVPYLTYLEVSTHHIISCSVGVESFHPSSSWGGVT